MDITKLVSEEKDSSEREVYGNTRDEGYRIGRGIGKMAFEEVCEDQENSKESEESE